MIGKLAVVLFNLGGPDSLSAVGPFLYNLFKDPAIITLPPGLRQLVAALIARRRTPVAREIYRKIGGSSPILAGTTEQAAALALALSPLAEQVKVVVAMRYWHPFSHEAVAELTAWQPDQVVLLPLYPQFSSTTTGSSLGDWHRSARQAGLTAPTKAICCYPRQPGWVMAQADLLRQALAAVGEATSVRVLLSAHGLPEKIIAAGDPYQAQIETSARAVIEAVGRDDLDWRICYQSRVGRLRWIGPSTEAEIAQAGRDGKGLVILPIAFVSEHSETLVELDIDYADRAKSAGVPFYRRIPALGSHPLFIEGLAAMVEQSLSGDCLLGSSEGKRVCAADRRVCATAKGL